MRVLEFIGLVAVIVILTKMVVNSLFGWYFMKHSGRGRWTTLDDCRRAGELLKKEKNTNV